MVTGTTDTPQVTIDGAPLKDSLSDALVSLVVETSVHAAGSAVLLFEDPLLVLFEAGGIDLGQAISVKIPDADGALHPAFKGEVTGIGVHNEDVPGSSPQARFLVEARDSSHRLAAASDFLSFQNMTVQDIVGKVAGRHGLTPEVGAPVASVKIPHLIQSGTDHALLTELAHRYGCEWFTSDKELHFRERPKLDKATTVSRLDGTLLDFSARYSGTQVPKEVTVHGRGLDTQLVTGKSGKIEAEHLGSDAPFVEEQFKQATKAFAKPLLVGTRAPVDGTDAEAMATAIMREHVGRGVVAQGRAICNPRIIAGQSLVIEGLTAKLDGSYYVTEVVHEFGGGQEFLLTRFVCDGHRVEEAPGARTANGGTWSDMGPVIGVVTQIDDPDKYGRVKVKFPSLGEVEAGVESDWARVVSVGAGAGAGVDFRPEIDDEVLVAFERGDSRFPLVLGGLWNDKTKQGQPDFGGGKVPRRALTSRTGHALVFGDAGAAGKKPPNVGFDDMPDPESDAAIALTTGDGENMVVLREDTGITIEVKEGKTITLKSGKTTMALTDKGIVFKTDKEFKVESQAGSVEIKVKEVKVEATSNVTVESKGGNVELAGVSGKFEAKTKLTLAGPAGVAIN